MRVVLADERRGIRRVESIDTKQFENLVQCFEQESFLLPWLTPIPPRLLDNQVIAPRRLPHLAPAAGETHILEPREADLDASRGQGSQTIIQRVDTAQLGRPSLEDLGQVGLQSAESGVRSRKTTDR